MKKYEVNKIITKCEGEGTEGEGIFITLNREIGILGVGMGKRYEGIIRICF